MANDEMQRVWASRAGGWVENEALFDALFAPVTEEILDVAGIDAGVRMLDVGCGSGSLLAAGVASGAIATGVDISPIMAEAARRRVPYATVVAEDAQTADLTSLAGAPFDRVVSRFGVMFFTDPAAAFANLRRATAPGGRLVFACWRGLDENPMFGLGADVLLARMEQRPDRGERGGPGPVAFADRDWVAGVLAEAGWRDAAVTPFDFTSDYGFRGTDGVEERMSVILSSTTGRAALAELGPRLGEAGWEALLDEVRAEIRRSMGASPRLVSPAATWLVTASS